MKKILPALFLLIFEMAYTQPTKPADYRLKAFKITDKYLGVISFYVDTIGINKRAPLFIDVNGSGGLPL